MEPRYDPAKLQQHIDMIDGAIAKLMTETQRLMAEKSGYQKLLEEAKKREGQG
jgi:hypothetical protein